MRFIGFVLATFLCCVAHGQIQVKETFAEYEPVEYWLDSVEGAKAVWEVRPLDGQFRYASQEYNKADRVVYGFWGQPGRYQLSATIIVVDFEAKTFEVDKDSRVFTIIGDIPPVPPVPPGPGPNPPDPPVPPKPTPAVPPDKFDNLGQRIDAQADKDNLQFDKRQALSTVYLNVVQGLEGGKYLTVTETNKYINAQENSLGLDSSWMPTRKILEEDGKKRSPMSREEAEEWYSAVAAGYKGGAL